MDARRTPPVLDRWTRRGVVTVATLGLLVTACGRADAPQLVKVDRAPAVADAGNG